MDERAQTRLCVLSSGSSGNCAVIRAAGATILIDAGLSPRRTRILLERVGLALDEIDAVILTHLDGDHWNPGWATGWPRCMRQDSTLHLHRAHIRRAERAGTLFARPTPFEDGFDLPGDTRVACRLLAHDDEGVASFRFTFPGATLGWATDAGRVTPALTDHLEGVDVLGIESNYCPRMQTRSGRPAFLIQRVMGGAGHLSNQECLQAVDAIAPREHVVLLHLSRDCNHPDLVADLHAGADYAFTIAARHEPTRWIDVGPHRPIPSTHSKSPAASYRPGAVP
jgi:phosphoribosyl 1,2-cyclic phosphodiesterase